MYVKEDSEEEEEKGLIRVREAESVLRMPREENLLNLLNLTKS